MFTFFSNTENYNVEMPDVLFKVQVIMLVCSGEKIFIFPKNSLDFGSFSLREFKMKKTRKNKSLIVLFL